MEATLSYGAEPQLISVARVLQSYQQISGSIPGVSFFYNDGNFSTTINMVCDTAASAGAPFVTSLQNSQLTITWNTRSSCPLCLPSDYTYADSSVCANSVMTRTWYQINPYCSGGFALPTPQTAPCQCLVGVNGGCDPLSACIDTFGGHDCSKCPSGYSGTGWTGCIPVCDPDCQNGGTCIFPQTCNCTGTRHYGGTCTTPICEPPCQHGGCIFPNTCDCTNTNYRGNLCNMPICTNPCINNGTCVSPDVCDCGNSTFYGPSCEYQASTDTGGIPQKLVIIIVVIGVLVLLSAMTALGVLYYRHKKLYSQYTHLISRDVPMDSEDKFEPTKLEEE